MKTPKFLEYIASDGHQFIDTAVQLSSHASVTMEARVTEPTDNAAAFFGTRKGNGYRMVMRFAEGSRGAMQVQITTGTRNPGDAYETWAANLKKDTEVTWRISCELYGRVNSVEGFPALARLTYGTGEGLQSESKTFQTGSRFSFPATMYLFACHDYDAGAVDLACMQLYRCTLSDLVPTVKDGRTYLVECPVRDFFPALDEEGRVCLYDAVTDSYFYSQTETDFLAGPEIGQTLFRVWQSWPGYVPKLLLGDVQALSVPQTDYSAKQPFDHPSDRLGRKYEFVGFDTAPASFTAVYPTRDYAGHGMPLPAILNGTVNDVYAVWKRIWGFLCRDNAGVFYGQNDDGSRRNLGVHELTAQVFRDYSFDSFPEEDMLTDLQSPSIMYWTKEGYEDDQGQQHYLAPRPFEATLTGVPPLPQLVTYPTVTLRKALAYITIPADPETTLWNVSFDGGATWYKYEDGWVAVTEGGDGCVKRRLEILDSDDWTPMLTNNTLTIRAWMWKNAWVSAIRVEYLEGD